MKFRRSKHFKRWLIGLGVYAAVWIPAFIFFPSAVSWCVTAAYIGYSVGSLAWYRVGLDDGVEIVYKAQDKAGQTIQQRRESAPWN